MGGMATRIYGMMTKLSGGFLHFCLAVCLTLCLLPGTGYAGAASDTMLMFVGEELEVLSIASGRQEAAWSAPAVARVITRDDMDEKNALTIADSLQGTPGFYLNKTEKGSNIYMRGIPDSALVLFDTVPMGSGVIKSDTMIDFETSLAPVKRIEVIRGTGSVLWGSDAFAGETGLVASTEYYPGEAFVNYGTTHSDWSSFLSVSGRKNRHQDDRFNVVKFWNDYTNVVDGLIVSEPLATRYGSGYPDDSHYISVYANAVYRDWLTFSVKIADNKNAYTVSDWDRNLFWQEQTAATTQMYKMEMSRNLTPDSDIRFTGYYTSLAEEHAIVDASFDRDESSLFGELIYDRSMFVSHGLLTLGTSYRRDRYEDIPVWNSFVPRLFQPDNEVFLPQLDPIDFENDLGAIFGQYRHDLGDVEVWAGVRYDDHDQYEDRTSFNAGLAWNLDNYMLKLLYGTGYRTPFARQLDEDLDHNLEKISRDRYTGAGLSMPNSQTIYGTELELDHQLSDRIKLGANLTLLRNSGPKEAYFYFIIDDIEQTFVKREYDYNMGPDILGTIKGSWQVTPHVQLVSELRYFAGQELYFPVEDATKSSDDAWNMDLHLHVKNLFPFDLSFFVTNVFDNDNSIPGVYSMTQPQPATAGIFLHMTW